MGGQPPLACGILSSSSDVEGCRAVVSGVIWIRLLDSARLIERTVVNSYMKRS